MWRLEGEPLSVTPGTGLLGVDVAFPVLHGPFGEDGTVQGLLEMLDVPYVGAGVAASAVCLDKVLFKELMGARAIPQVDYVGVRADAFASEPETELARIAELGLPVFVKPAHLGSSVGIVKVSDAAEMAGALEQAFAHDALVIVEALAAGAEVECGVLGALPGEADGRRPALASLPGEILFAGEWYDYAAKYTPGGHAPADTRPGVRRRAGAGARAGRADVPRLRMRGAGPRRLLRERRGGARQRAQHDARFHADERLRKAARGLRRALSRAARSPLPARARAPSPAPGAALLRRGGNGRTRGPLGGPARLREARRGEASYLKSVTSAIVADCRPGGRVVIHTR